MKKAPIFQVFTRLSVLVVSGGLLVLASACGSSSSNSNDAGGGGGSSGGGSDTAKYNFENAMDQGWKSGSMTDVITSLMSSTAQKFAGAASLAVNITAPAAAIQLYSAEVDISPTVAIAAGTSVTFHVYIPADAPIDWVQPFIQEDLTYLFAGKYTAPTKGGWNNISVEVPATYTNPIYKMGVQIHNTDTWTGAVYIDSVNW